MKDKFEVWNRIIKRTYSAVNTNSNEPNCSQNNTPRDVARRIVTGKYKSKLTNFILFLLQTAK